MNLLSSFLVVIVVIVAQTAAEECKKQNQCQCVYEDGTGYDLKSVVGDQPLRAITAQNLMFFFHPCGDIKTVPGVSDNVTDTCKLGYTLCMYDINNKTTTVLGKQDNMDWKVSNEGIMQVIFTQTDQEKESTIELQCAEKEKNAVLYAPDTAIDPQQVHLTLFSQFACPTQVEQISHHGVFYKLFIILLTLLFAYLFFGILINYFLIGARGYELIPNYDFWCTVWKSMKLFYIYVKNGCRVIPAEDSYDAI